MSSNFGAAVQIILADRRLSGAYIKFSYHVITLRNYVQAPSFNKVENESFDESAYAHDYHGAYSVPHKAQAMSVYIFNS
jgi:hypothetical protein